MDRNARAARHRLAAGREMGSRCPLHLVVHLPRAVPVEMRASL
jgi:hypothetical protein